MTLTMPTNCGKKGFTAIELIIVVAIVLILMGMLVPVVTSARARAKKKLTKTEIQGICIALERYFAETGEYPPDNSDYGKGEETVTLGGDGSTATSLYYYLCGPQGKGIQVPGDPRVYGPYTTFKRKRLRPHEGSYVVVDSWGNAYVYEEHRSVFASSEAVRWKPFQRAQEAVKRRAHNKMSYDLFSMGPNRELDISRHDMIDNDTDGAEDEEDERLDSDDDEPDDVTNW